jgi:hypothetical protein
MAMLRLRGPFIFFNGNVSRGTNLSVQTIETSIRAARVDPNKGVGGVICKSAFAIISPTSHEFCTSPLLPLMSFAHHPSHLS